MSQKGSRAGLLSIVLLLMASVTMIHGRKALPSPAGSDPLQLSMQDALDVVAPLLISKSFDDTAYALSQFDQSTVLAAAQKILSESGFGLSKKDRIIFLLCLLAVLDNPSLHMQFYKMLKNDYSQDPVYAYGIINNINKGVERLYKMVQKQDEKVAQTWAEESFKYAVEKNNVDALDRLYVIGIRVLPKFASELLSDVVEKGKNVDFVSSLVRNMQADPNYSADGLKTVLIRAIELNNEPMVRALLEKGADPEIMLDEETGTALETAYQLGRAKIQILLNEARKK